MFGNKKKKKIIEEEYEEGEEELDEDSEDEEDKLDREEKQEIPHKVREQSESKQLTKEEIGALAEYHQARALELFSIYRRM